MPTYVKNSTKLKKEFETLKLPPNARLFKADAVYMYTNIDTKATLFKISAFLQANKTMYWHIPIEALITGLSLVMRNNVFILGDTQWKQNSGAAMGQPPSPPYSTVFFGIQEICILKKFPQALILYNRRYIDDYIGVCIPMEGGACEQMWRNFKKEFNNYHGLT